MDKITITAAAVMAAAYDTDPYFRGLIAGAAATIQELTRQGLLPPKEDTQCQETN